MKKMVYCTVGDHVYVQMGLAVEMIGQPMGKSDRAPLHNRFQGKSQSKGAVPEKVQEAVDMIAKPYCQRDSL